MKSPGNETIAAVATSAGGGIGVVRISGPDSLAIAARIFRAKNGRYADDLAALGPADIRVENLTFAPTLQATRDLYEMSARGFGGATLHIRQDGRTWVK